MVDNYDSFTYNLVHYLEALNCSVTVCFNDAIPENDSPAFDAVVLSPGPGLPEESGGLMSFLQLVLGKKPVLGVCLGMQALAIELGGSLFNQQQVKHGVQEQITVSGSSLFRGFPNQIEVGLYHSWGVTESESYEIIARSKNGVIMALENEEMQCYGIQFHPESIMTPEGKNILRNFLALIPEREQQS